jgi:hypothetical protein
MHSQHMKTTIPLINSLTHALRGFFSDVLPMNMNKPPMPVKWMMKENVVPIQSPE